MGRQKPINVSCPCCKAVLTIDTDLEVVLSHTEPPKAPSSVDLNDPFAVLSKQAADREAKFQASWDAEKKKDDVLTRKFEENLKKAKEGPAEKPVRDFDLD